MRFESLQLKAFGQFCNHNIDLSAGPSRFHLIYGPNESGKSTCLRAITSLFFGIPRSSTDNYLHANNKLRIGATLINEHGEPISLIRRKNGAKLYQADDKTAVDESVMSDLLGGIDEPAFLHRFGLSHQDLVNGGKLVLQSKGELGEILFAAGAGVGQLNAIATQLDNDSRELFVERGRKTINELLKELDAKRKQLRDMQTLPAQYNTLVQSIEEAESKHERLNEKCVAIAKELTRLRSYRDAANIVPAWQRDRARLQELSAVPQLDDDFAARRREAIVNLKTYQSLSNSSLQTLSDLSDRLEKVSVDSVCLENEREIMSLYREISAQQTAANDQLVLFRLVKNHNRHLRELLRDLQIECDSESTQEQIDQAVSKVHVNDATQVRITELAGEYELVRSREAESTNRLQVLKRQIVDINEKWKNTPSPGDPKIIQSVLSDMGSPSALLEPVQQQEQVCDELRDQCESLLSDLRLKDIELKPAVLLRMPSSDEIDRHEERLLQRTAELENRRRKCDELSQRQQQTASELARLQTDQPLPDESELVSRRQFRDEAIDGLEEQSDDFASTLRVQMPIIRKSVRSADDVVDTIRMHHQQVAQRAAAQRELQEIAVQLQAAENAHKDSETQLSETQIEWKSLWEALNISSGSVREMRQWIATHASLKDKFESLSRNEKALANARQRVERYVQRLTSALQLAWSLRPAASLAVQDSDVVSSEMPWHNGESASLESVHDAATSLHDEFSRSGKDWEELKRKRVELQESLPEAEANCDSAVARREQWDAAWRRATESFSTDNDSSPAVISRRLKIIAQIFQEKRERDIVLGRIRSIDNNQTQFAATVHNVAKLVSMADLPSEPPSNVDDASELTQSLYSRLQSAKSDAKEHSRLVATKDEEQAKLGKSRQTLELSSNQLQQLCREASVDDEERLPEVEQLSIEKRETGKRVRVAEEKLALISRGIDTADFAEQVLVQDPDTLESEITSLEAELEQLSDTASNAREQVGELKGALKQIDGGDTAADLNQSIQFLTARINRHAQEYARLRVASLILQRAIEHYRSENESPVLSLACEAFEELTCGRYVGLKPEYDDKGRSKLFGVQKSSGEDEVLVPVDAMSLGTADALYLSLRLASLEHQLSSGSAIPVVIDDCLIQLDDERTIATMKRFVRLASKTQVILFTHHQHLVELAKSVLEKDQFHVHELLR